MEEHFGVLIRPRAVVAVRSFQVVNAGGVMYINFTMMLSSKQELTGYFALLPSEYTKNSVHTSGAEFEIETHVMHCYRYFNLYDDHLDFMPRFKQALAAAFDI